ncbi:hypothetical protein ACWKWP_17150 [Agromyces soli]
MDEHEESDETARDGRRAGEGERGEGERSEGERSEGERSEGERGAALERVVEQARSAALLGETDDVRRTVAELLREAGLQSSPHDIDAVVSAVGDAPSGG